MIKQKRDKKIKMVKINKNNLKVRWSLISIILVLSLLFILYIIIPSEAYYTNLNKYFGDSRTADGNGGYALKRVSNEFIVDGCGTGTMLDTVTGLCWDKNMNHNGSALQWSVNTYSEPTWNNVTKVYSYPNGKANYPAFSYCEDLSLGGQTDFRLPTINELFTLVNHIDASLSTCTSLTGFGFTNCQNNYYWTYKEYQPSTTNAWLVAFGDGVSTYNLKTMSFSVLCVR